MEEWKNGRDEEIDTLYVYKANHGPRSPAEREKATLDDIGGAQLPPRDVWGS